MDAIIHCASFFDADGSTHRLAIRHLIDAADGAAHLVYISIVGVDRTAFPYFQTKLEVEMAVAASGLPHTIVRSTQFHDFVRHLIAGFEDPLAGTIVLPEGLSFQSIDVGEAAVALVGASEGAPAGRAPDIAGPQILALDEMAKRYARTLGLERIVTSGEDPQRDFHDSFRDGRNLAPKRAVGCVTWEEFLKVGRTSVEPGVHRWKQRAATPSLAPGELEFSLPIRPAVTSCSAASLVAKAGDILRASFVSLQLKRA